MLQYQTMGERDRSLVGVLRGLLSKNTEFQGGVTTGDRARERVKDIVHTVSGSNRSEGSHLAEPDMSDRYGGEANTVSIEREGRKQMIFQERLDQQIVDENLGVSHHDKRGLQPCQRVRKGDS